MSQPDYVTKTKGFTITVKFSKNGDKHFGKVDCPVTGCNIQLVSNGEAGYTQAKYNVMERVTGHFRRKHPGLQK
jgi:hypothetical protein